MRIHGIGGIGLLVFHSLESRKKIGITGLAMASRRESTKSAKWHQLFFPPLFRPTFINFSLFSLTFPVLSRVFIAIWTF